MKRNKHPIQKKHRRRYDLPLHRSVGARFMVWIVGLMIFLATFALWGNFALSQVTERWASGLTGRLTVEIRSASSTIAQDQAVGHVLGILNKTEGIKSARKLDKSEIAELVKPWLGTNISTDILPLPVLIDVTLSDPALVDTDKLRTKIQDRVPQADIDDHSAWLQDLLSLAHAIEISALILTLVVGATAIVVVASAARTRLALHFSEVELLHLIGASNSYIAGQFQRHAFRATLKGALGGLTLALLALFGLSQINNDEALALLPDVSLSFGQWSLLVMLPLAGCLIATLTARITVQNTIARMP